MLVKEQLNYKSLQLQTRIKKPIKQHNNNIPSIDYLCNELDEQNINKKYVDANSKSCGLIKSGLLKQALCILQNCQKQIEQQQKYGKKINEIVINTTLHNLSATYQKMGNNSKSLQILRILLYYINNRFNRFEQQCDFSKRMLQLNMEITVTKYYIYFLSLTIQLKMFEAATIPTNRIFQFMKKFCKDYRKSQLNLVLINTKMTADLLNQIQQFQALFNSSSIWELMDNLKQAVFKVKKIPISNQASFSKIRKFNVYNLTAITPLQMTIGQKGITTKYYNNRSFQNGLIEFPVALFLIGKAHHQSTCAKYKTKQDAFQKLANLEKTKQYILWSLYFACQLCPYLTPLHKQIYEYYQTNLNKVQQQYSQKNIKIISSLNSPSLKDFDAWKEIKTHLVYLDRKNTEKFQNDNKNNANQPILNQYSFNKILLVEKQKILKISSRAQSIKISSSKKLTRRNSEQLFKDQRNLLTKQIIQNRLSLQRQKIGMFKNQQTNQKLKTKTKSIKQKVSKKKQKSQSSNSVSNSKKSINSRKIKSKKAKIQQKNTFLDQYFPKQPQKKLKVAEKAKKQVNKQFISNYLNLQKKIRQSSKSLSKKKKKLFKSIKKI